MDVKSLSIQAGQLLTEVSRTNQEHPLVRADKFAEAMRSQKPAKGNLGIANTGNIQQISGTVVNSKQSKEAVSKALESMLVAQFLSPLLADSDSSFFGTGVQGDITKSLFTDAIAKSITESGGIGLGKFF